jgi:hypothetical protein
MNYFNILGFAAAYFVEQKNLCELNLLTYPLPLVNVQAVTMELGRAEEPDAQTDFRALLGGLHLGTNFLSCLFFSTL